MKDDYDTLIIGGGPGGLAAAYTLQPSQKLMVIEGNLWGGTCPNFGCDPKKMLYGVVENRRQAQNYGGKGIAAAPKVNWPDMMAFKHSYTDKVPTGTEVGLEGSGIEHRHGQAEFVDAHTVRVGDEQISAQNIIIATGAHPAKPDVAGADLLETSTNFLNLPDLPAEIGFIGGGYVAIELANIAVLAGSRVHIIQHNERILRGFPEEYSTIVAKQLAAKGVQFHWNTSVNSVTKDDAGGVTALTDAGTELHFDHLYAATGRPANIDGLNLAAAGIASERGGITVDENLRTTAANVYAVGDVVARKIPKLTPVAGLEGRYVARVIQGDKDPIVYPPIPHVVFAGPELAEVGVDLSTAERQSGKYEVTTQDVGSWYTYQRLADKDARVTTITDRKSGQLVGAVVLAADAEELINYLTALITAKAPATALSKWVPAYPSVASDLGYFYN
ncbi:dihydrolipoyl dehydrogenase family protein [Lacticaseibacillus zhaodongensis]|uniref:dihydrolipoyl dehydrogenase family protein n=1 Tax=Lacticaseibacillus zhaodongensis TaxID=2668065 RepID=UPI0012D34E8B|nr:NAD(P)/FAD-dependent oxidoreductase [Lacticaseibacillus zhaodongensis]